MDRLIAQYGLALVFANVLLEQPIPAVPALVVAGAFSAEGEFSPLAAFGVAFVACMMGDALWYLAGRRYGRRVMKLLCRLSLPPASCVPLTAYPTLLRSELTRSRGMCPPITFRIAPTL